MTRYLYQGLTHKVIGAAFEVHKILGPVHKESVYQKAFSEELASKDIPFKTEVSLDVIYKGKKVGVYKPDFVIDDKVLVEIKAVASLPKAHDVQLSYYLKGTDYKVGLLINFGERSLVVRRRIYDRISANQKEISR